jgi:hypothetical protein
VTLPRHEASTPVFRASGTRPTTTPQSQVASVKPATPALPPRRADPPGMLWCSMCRRHHPMPVCESCGTELLDLPHRLVMVCEPCKAAARQRRAEVAEP